MVGAVAVGGGGGAWAGGAAGDGFEDLGAYGNVVDRGRGVDQDDAGDGAAFLEEDAGGLEGDDAAEGPACGWVECVNGGYNRGKKFLGVRVATYLLEWVDGWQ